MHCGQNLTEIIFKIVKRFLKGNIVIYRSERYLSYQKDHSTLSFYPLIQLTSDPQKSKAHLRVSEAVLYTLAGYLDWVSMNLIFTNNSVLLQMLCLLLGNSSLQLLAAECLLTIVGRKVNYNQEVFFICFSSNCIIFTLKIMVHIVHVYSSKDWKTTVVRCLLFLLSLTLSFKKKLFYDHQLSNLLSMQLSYIFIL